MFTNYKRFKKNIRQVFENIKQQNTAEKELQRLKQHKLVAEYIAKF
jgi:hypothetical protein